MSDVNDQRIGLVRLGWLGFVAGAVMHIVAVTFALLSNIGETLLFVLTPGGLVARELGLANAEWSGVINVGLAMVANGVIYAVGLMLLLTAWRRLRRADVF